MWLKLRNHPLFWITASGVFLRLTYFFLIFSQHPEGFWAYDSGEYWRLAENLFNQSEFSKSNGAPFEPEHLRTPLYPVFLGLIQAAGGGLFSAILTQLILSTLTILLIWKATLNISQSRLASGTAALFIALDIPSIVFGNYILSETLYVFLLSVCLLFFSRYIGKSKWQDLAAFGFFTGLSALCRPSSILLIILWTALLFMFRNSLKRSVTNALIFLSTALLAISPWLIRNHLTFGKVFFSTTSDFMIAAWQAPNVKAISENKTVSQARYELWTDWYYNSPYDAYHQPLDYMKYIRRKSISIMADHPEIVVKQHLLGVFHLLFKPARGQFLNQLHGETNYQPVKGKQQLELMNQEVAIRKTPAWLWAIITFQFVMLAVLYSGLLFLLIRFNRISAKRRIFFLVLTSLLLINMVVPPVTNARFRMPAMPFLVVLSGIGLSLFREKRNVKDLNLTSQRPD